MQGFATVALPVEPIRAFMTDDVVEVIRFAAAMFDAGHGVALATVVQIRGGSARPLGSHMAIRDDGRYCGFVSGGCTEAAVASEAVEAVAKGCDRNLLLGEGSRFFDIVLPCGGGITIAIHVLRDSRPLNFVLAEVAGRRQATRCYGPAAQSLSIAAATRQTGWSDDAFFTQVRPRIRIVVAGRSIEMEVTAKVAAAAGYDVLTCSGVGNQLPDHAIDANTAVALLYHDIDLETPVFKAALASPAFYIGALGSSRTHARRIERLKGIGFGENDISRIRSPIGIFPKAKDSQSLALSVVADIAACRSAAA
jgi:xanthine dehydrogenase accessory factor